MVKTLAIYVFRRNNQNVYEVGVDIKKNILIQSVRIPGMQFHIQHPEP